MPWRDTEGNIIGTMGVAHDITDRVLAEEKLLNEVAERQHAEQFLDSIIDNLPTMLFVKEANELRFVRWNKAGELITGSSKDALLGKNDYDYFRKKRRISLWKRTARHLPEEWHLKFPKSRFKRSTVLSAGSIAQSPNF